jgi:hypothetical protein
MTAAARFGHCARTSIFCVQLLVAGTSGWLEPAHAAEYSEDAVKAAYLYRFSGYVEWPVTAQSTKTFVIAVVDAPAVARELKRLVPGHQINNRIIDVVEATHIKDTGRPAILFIGAGHADLLRPALPELAAESTLVVTDEAGGLEEGGTLNFLTLDHRVRFEVSLTAADREHLKISAELLAVAVRVFGGGRQSREVPTDCRFWNDCAMSDKFDPS